MDDNLNSISEIMKPTHLQKINPIPRDKSMVPFGFGIIPTGRFVQYNKDMIPYREYIKLLRVAIKLNTYFLQDVSDMDTVVASMEIKNLQGKHQKRLYDKWVVNIIYIVHCWYADIVLVYAMTWLLPSIRIYWNFHYFLIVPYHSSQW